MSEDKLNKIFELLKDKFPKEIAELGIDDCVITETPDLCVKHGQSLTVLGRVGPYVVCACKQGKKIVRILFMLSGIWGAIDFVTPGNTPDAFEIGELITNSVPKHQHLEPSDNPQFVVYHENWSTAESNDELRHQIQALNTSDSQQLSDLHFMPAASGISPEVFQNGRVIEVSAENFLHLSDDAELS